MEALEQASVAAAEADVTLCVFLGGKRPREPEPFAVRQRLDPEEVGCGFHVLRQS